MKTYFFGLIMGLVDLVPGISGGTVAYLFGVLKPLMSSLSRVDLVFFHALRKGRFRESWDRINGRFLFPLLLGIASALLLFAGFVEKALNSPELRPILFCFFLGSLLYSCFKLLSRIQTWRFATVFAFSVGAIFSGSFSTGKASSEESFYHLTLSRPQAEWKSMSIINYDSKNQQLLNVPKSTLMTMHKKGMVTSDEKVWDTQKGTYIALTEIGDDASFGIFQQLGYLGAGILASTAMLLPGISGSSVLLCMGYYFEVLGAVADMLRYPSWEPIVLLSFFGGGVLIGFSLISRVFLSFFERYPDPCNAGLTGMVLGSFYTLWPFWNTAWMLIPTHLDKGLRLHLIEPILPAQDQLIMGAIAASVAVAILRALEKQSSRIAI